MIIKNAAFTKLLFVTILTRAQQLPYIRKIRKAVYSVSLKVLQECRDSVVLTQWILQSALEQDPSGR